MASTFISLPVAATTDVIIENPTINVSTTAFGSTPDSMLFVGSDDGTETGVRRVVKIDTDGTLKVDGSGVTQPVSISGSVPVTGPLTDAQLRATAVPVSAASLPLPTGAATETTLNSVKTAVELIDNTVATDNTTAPANALVVGGVTAGGVFQTFETNGSGHLNIADGGGSITVDGTVTANAGTGTFAVSAASLPLPTGAATEATLSAINTKTPALGQALMAASQPVVIASNQSTVPVSAASLPLPSGAATSALQTTGNTSLSSIDTKTPALGQALMAASQPVVIASNQSAISVTGPLTDAQLRATAVPVSGPLTDTQLRATAVPVSAASLPLPTGAATAANQATGNASLASIDTKLTSPLTVTGPLTDAQLRATAVPVSLGSSPLPTGAATAALQSNVQSAVGTSATTAITVQGSATGAALPISASSLPLPTGAATAALQTTGNTSLSSIDTKTPALVSGRVPVDGSGVTQPVSGTITANIGTTNGLALDATLTSGAQKAIARGGAKGTTTAADVTSTNVDANTQALDVSIKSSSTIAVTGPLTDAQLRATAVPVSGPLTDTQLRASAVPISGTVTATISGTPTVALDAASLAALESVTVQNGAGASAVNIQDGGNSITVDGTVAVSGSVAVTGPLTDTQLRATAVPVSLTSTTITGSVAVTGPLTDTQLRATPVPVSGTVTANLGTIAGVATETTLAAINTKIPASPSQDRTTAAAPFATRLTDGTAFYKATTPADTQPISAASLPLPTGAATSALQTTGNTSLSTIATNTTNLTVAQGSTTAGQTGQLTQGAVTTAAPTYTTGQTSPLSLSTNGSLRVLAPASDALLTTIAANTGAQATDTIVSGTITALNGAVAINAQGAYTITAQISGTWVATLVAEGLLADNVTWQQLPMYVLQTALPYPSTFTVTTNAAVSITGGGYTQIRIRASAFTSGTVNVALNASLAQQTIFSSQLGTWSVNSIPVDGNKATYSAGVTGLVPAATATDIFTITGSASRTIKITRVAVSATQTTGGTVNVSLLKRSTANTAGTSTAVAAVAHDSTSAAATATVLAYTANPTLGTIVGSAIRTNKLFVSTATATGDDKVWTFGDRPSQCPVLRGTTQVIAVNLNATTVTGGSFAINIEWTEE